jgi:hypothetical protein
MLPKKPAKDVTGIVFREHFSSRPAHEMACRMNEEAPCIPFIVCRVSVERKEYPMANFGRNGVVWNWDVPQLEALTVPAANGGTSNDPYGLVIGSVPDLRHGFLPRTLAEGVQGGLKPNRMQMRVLSLINNSPVALLGQLTHPCDFRVNVYRNGIYQGPIAFASLNLSTTLGMAITAANVNTHAQVTPPSMAGILPGVALIIDGGTATQELVYVESTTATTFTAYFTQLHTTSATVQAGLLPYLATDMLPCDAVLAPTTSTTAVSTAGLRIVGLNAVYGVHVGDSVVCDTSTPQETVKVLAMGAVNTTGSAIGSTGSQVCTPASMAGIVVGAPVVCDTGAARETVTATAVTATTFTANFTQTHAANFRLQSDWFQATFLNAHSAGFAITPATTPAIPGQPVLGNGAPFELQAGDVITYMRVSADTTGVATPSCLIQFDWIPSERLK